MREKVHTVKSVLVTTSIKQAACIKQACIHFPKKADALKCTCINPIALREGKIVYNFGLPECNRVKQAPVLSKYIFIIP